MKRILATCLLIFTTLSVRAVEVDTLKMYDMDNVVITATRTPLPLKSSPVLTRVITAAEIERQGVSTLENLLERELAGVEFHQAGYGTTLSFQGFDARYVLFLVDGERVAGETYGNIDYARIPLGNIERIEIVRGASSVLYGSSAMGATVNIITRMPVNRVEVSGSFRFGTRHQKNADEAWESAPGQSDLRDYRDKLDLPNTRTDLSVGFNLGKFRSLTSGTFRTVDAYKLRGTKDEVRHYGTLTKMGPKTMGVPMEFQEIGYARDTTLIVSPDSRGLGVSGWRDWNVSQKFDYVLSDKFRFEANGYYFRKDRYDFLNSIMDDNPMSGVLSNILNWSHEKYEGYNGKFVMEHSPNADNKVYVSYLRDEYIRKTDTLGVVTPKQRHAYNIPRLLWTLNAGDWNRVTTGAEMINEELRFDLNPAGYNDKKKLNTASLYVQDEILSGRRLSFVVGLRGDWNSKFGWRATPKFSAKYDFYAFSLRANYSNGYRSPSLKEMYMRLDIPIAGSPTITGNPSLKAETNHYISLSLDYNRDWVYLSAGVSHSFFRDKIDARYITDENGQMALFYDNIDKSRVGNVEAITRFRLTKGLYVNANYNYIFRHDESTEGATQYIFPSPHTATVSVDYGFQIKRNTRMNLNANIRYVGPKDYDDMMSYLEFPDAAANFIRDVVAGGVRPPTVEEINAMRGIKYFTGNYSARHKGYAVCNFTVDVTFPKWFSLTVGIDNIFNYRPEVVNFNSAIVARRNGFARVGFRF